MSSTTSATAPLSATTPDPKLRCRTTVWYTILGSSIGLYAAVLLIILLLRVAIVWARKRKSNLKQQQQQQELSSKMPMWPRVLLLCKALIKGSNSAGKLMLAIYSLCVVASFIVYVLLTYQFTDVHLDSRMKTLLICYSPNEFPIIHLDFAINIYYLFVFVIRFLASDTIISFWVSLDTFADHMTIIPCFIMYFTRDYMIAFQYARLVGLRFIVNTLIYCNILKAEKYIRLLTLLFRIFTIWAASAGFYQLLEVIGDFWDTRTIATTATFLQFHDCFYFMLITMSTVGYGDISPNTVLGKIFIVLFIVIALGVFTSIIPEVSEILTDTKKYKRNQLHLKAGMKHLTIVGNFTKPLTKTLFADFFHEARAPEKRDFIALLGESEPSLDIKAVLKTRDLYVTYLQGDVMRIKDLKRIKVQQAAAVILLADARSQDPEDEDMKNIMRVIAVKDYCPTVSVLVQLQMYRSKTYLRNIPDWSAAYGDQAVCIYELKFGLLAQSCMVPGVSTLLCNLLMLRSVRGPDCAEPGSWQSEYLAGVGNDFHLVAFADSFNGMTFQQACSICYEKFNVLLLAVEIQVADDDATSTSSSGAAGTGSSRRRVVINPGSGLVIETKQMLAFVVAQTDSQAMMMSNTDLEESNGNASAVKMVRYGKSHGQYSNHYTNTYNFDNQDSKQTRSRLASSDMQQSCVDMQHIQSAQSAVLDSSGYFHWTCGHSVQSVLLDPYEEHRFKGHLIVCVLERTLPLSVTSFLMPLRASWIDRGDLKDIVFVGNAQLFHKEWSIIQNFPKIYLLDGSPLNRANLKSVNIENCDCCFIMSPKVAAKDNGAQADRDVILCTLNIKTMQHSETGMRLGDTIHIVTELSSEESIAYLDQDDDQEVEHAFMAQPFATGRTFYQSLLDSIVTTIYFNQAALGFLRTLVTTVDSDAFEVDLNEQGFHFVSPPRVKRPTRTLSHSHSSPRQRRSHIVLLSVDKPPIGHIFRANNQCRWKQLLLQSLAELQMVCIGLSRLQVETPRSKNHRYVVTLPPADTVLRCSDMVYCLTSAEHPL